MNKSERQDHFCNLARYNLLAAFFKLGNGRRHGCCCYVFWSRSASFCEWRWRQSHQGQQCAPTARTAAAAARGSKDRSSAKILKHPLEAGSRSRVITLDYQRLRPMATSAELEVYWTKLEELKEHKQFAESYIKTLATFEPSPPNPKLQKVVDGVRTDLGMFLILCDETRENHELRPHPLKTLQGCKKTLAAILKRAIKPQRVRTVDRTSSASEAVDQSPPSGYPHECTPPMSAAKPMTSAVWPWPVADFVAAMATCGGAGPTSTMPPLDGRAGSSRAEFPVACAALPVLQATELYPVATEAMVAGRAFSFKEEPVRPFSTAIRLELATNKGMISPDRPAAASMCGAGSGSDSDTADAGSGSGCDGLPARRPNKRARVTRAGVAAAAAGGGGRRAQA